MRFTSFILSLLLTAIVLVGTFKPANSYTDDEANTISVYSRSKDAIVSIVTMNQEGSYRGAGAFIDSDGSIITAFHVVRNARLIAIHTADGNIYDAKVTAIYRLHDLAVLKVDASRTFPYLTMKPLDDILIGQKVLVIGFPLFERQLSVGHVSQIHQLSGKFIVDAAINPGNSGGPVLDSDGFIIGIASEMHNPAGIRANAGIGGVYAVDDVITTYLHSYPTPK